MDFIASTTLVVYMINVSAQQIYKEFMHMGSDPENVTTTWMVTHLAVVKD